MEPQNHQIEREKNLPNLHFFGFKMSIFQGVGIFFLTKALVDALVACIFDRLSPVADVLETGELKFEDVMKFTPRKEIWGREGSCLEFVATMVGHKKNSKKPGVFFFTRV